ncbi:hypothetical protein FEI15_08780 [Lacticaseibacillus zeae]|uniref:Uncharacterized protein n=1 Tax=Lacticaseibacillus zeae TaxID=57037 RepID=A0A5R8LPE6_LACZE|nr:hypothetical protein [Lacticaseibacillus zeae]TLF39117.1 hypothetical protein FEI15_08780 [Lacticaseibacillus zeae]
MKANPLFKKRYRLILQIVTFWLAAYTFIIRNLFPHRPFLVDLLITFVVPFVLITYLTTLYFKLKVAKPWTLVLLLVLLGMLILVALQLFKIVSL